VTVDCFGKEQTDQFLNCFFPWNAILYVTRFDTRLQK
jgi:hypothetical protein